MPREIVTSENLNEFISKKLKLKGKKKPFIENEEDEEDEDEDNVKHPIAPVPDKKYIIGTKEHKEHKKKSKPINGMPTNKKNQ